MVKLPARYSFTLVKRDGRWLIADHHSSTCRSRTARSTGDLPQAKTAGSALTDVL